MNVLPLEGRVVFRLVMPPAWSTTGHRRCRRCAMAGREDTVGRAGRHFVQCPHGIRRPATCHDEVRDALVAILDAALPQAMVVAERPGIGGHRAIDEWMRDRARRADGTLRLQHRPDIVLLGLDGPGTFTIIDVKTFDPAGPTWVERSHTDTTPRAAHVALEHRTLRQYFGPAGTLPDGDPLRGRLRVCTFALSTFGAFGQPALDLLRDVGRRSADRLPAALSDDSTWAACELGPYARMRLSLALRRALAHSLSDAACSEAEAHELRHRGAPAYDPRHTLDGGLGLPAEEEEDA